MRKKLRDSRGETLVETLAAIFIIALCIGFLATAVVTAARINRTVRDTDNAFHPDAAPTGEEASVRIDYENGFPASGEIQVTLFQTENGYLYYTK